ncbi:MAG: hypothetical protein AAF570_06750, partial [Bacteroidota bacterium]
ANVQDFIKKAADPMTMDTPAYKEAIVAGFLLDMNDYERKQMASQVDSFVELLKLREALANGTVPAEEIVAKQGMVEVYEQQFSQYFETMAFEEILVDEQLRAAFGQLMVKPPAELVMLTQGFVHHNTTTPASGLIYENPLGEFGPTKITAHLKKGGQPDGSSAGGDPAWMLKLERRREPGGTSIYIRGHMLNRHLGGAGLDYNMVPLTGTHGPKFGGNDANGEHSSGIEETVKGIYARMPDQGAGDLNSVKDLVYTVEAVFGDHQRPHAAWVTDLSNTFNEWMEEYRNRIKDEKYEGMDEPGLANAMLGATKEEFRANVVDDKERAYRQLLGRLGQKMDPVISELGDPSERAKIYAHFGINENDDSTWLTAFDNHYAPELAHQQYNLQPNADSVRLALSFRDFRIQILERTIDTLDQQLKDELIQRIDGKEGMRDFMAGSAITRADDPMRVKIDDLNTLMRENAELWRYEDVSVPLKLICTVQWTENQIVQQQPPVEIPNRLPTTLLAPFDPRD